jgi:hypothetical protein
MPGGRCREPQGRPRRGRRCPTPSSLPSWSSPCRVPQRRVRPGTDSREGGSAESIRDGSFDEPPGAEARPGIGDPAHVRLAHHQWRGVGRVEQRLGLLAHREGAGLAGRLRVAVLIDRCHGDSAKDPQWASVRVAIAPRHPVRADRYRDSRLAAEAVLALRSLSNYPQYTPGERRGLSAGGRPDRVPSPPPARCSNRRAHRRL